MNREEHLDWCKARALEYADSGELTEAFSSMVSDLRKHPETENHGAIALMFAQLMAGFLDTPENMRKFIEGFN